MKRLIPKMNFKPKGSVFKVKSNVTIRNYSVFKDI